MAQFYKMTSGKKMDQVKVMLRCILNNIGSAKGKSQLYYILSFFWQMCVM